MELFCRVYFIINICLFSRIHMSTVVECDQENLTPDSFQPAAQVQVQQEYQANRNAKGDMHNDATLLQNIV